MTTVVALCALIVSVYGAGLATIVWLDNRRRDRKRVLVQCSFGYEKDRDDESKVVPVIIVRAVNGGPRPVEISGAGFLVGDSLEEVERRPYAVRPSSAPYRLEDGASIAFSYRTQHDVPAAQAVEVVRVFVRNSDDQRWYGAPDNWLRPLMISRQWW